MLNLHGASASIKGLTYSCLFDKFFDRYYLRAGASSPRFGFYIPRAFSGLTVVNFCMYALVMVFLLLIWVLVLRSGDYEIKLQFFFSNYIHLYYYYLLDNTCFSMFFNTDDSVLLSTLGVKHYINVDEDKLQILKENKGKPGIYQ